MGIYRNEYAGEEESGKMILERREMIFVTEDEVDAGQVTEDEVDTGQRHWTDGGRAGDGGRDVRAQHTTRLDAPRLWMVTTDN